MDLRIRIPWSAVERARELQRHGFLQRLAQRANSWPSNTPGYDNSIIRNVRGITTPGAEFTANIKITHSLSGALGYTYDVRASSPAARTMEAADFAG